MASNTAVAERPKRGYCNVSMKTLSKLKRNDTVTYRIIGLGQVNPATGEPVIPADETFISDYTFHDPNEEDEYSRDKLIKNVTGHSLVEDGKGGQFRKESTAAVVFQLGFITVVPSKQLGLFVYLELHPNNASNKWRPGGATPVFERVQEAPTTRDLLLHEELIEQATSLARRMSLADKRVVLGDKANGKDSDAILYDVLQLAKASPREFIENAPDEKSKIKLHVTDALANNLLTHDEDTRKFILAGKKKEAIFTYAPGAPDPTRALIDHLSEKDNRESYEKLVTVLTVVEEDE